MSIHLILIQKPNRLCLNIWLLHLSQAKLPADTNQSGAWSILVGPLTEPAPKITTEKGPALLAADVSLIYMIGAVAGRPPMRLHPLRATLSCNQNQIPN
ncbi:MAG: hypothetical protein HRT37_24740 [Alteromonadaceae bacterium]|nr:hypothetical protein [Alteromonadaceae bacterium]